MDVDDIHRPVADNAVGNRDVAVERVLGAGGSGHDLTPGGK